MDGVLDRYPYIWRTIKFHKFEKFTKSQIPFVPTQVREFYEAYARLLLKGNKKEGRQKVLDAVDVLGVKVK